MNELLKIKEDLTKERDDLLGDVVKLREDLTDSQNQLQNKETEHTEAHQKIQEVGDRL